MSPAFLEEYAHVIHDKGGELAGEEFQTMLLHSNINFAPNTTKNPQGNVICERMHQSVGNILRTLLLSN